MKRGVQLVCVGVLAIVAGVVLYLRRDYQALDMQPEIVDAEAERRAIREVSRLAGVSFQDAPVHVDIYGLSREEALQSISVSGLARGAILAMNLKTFRGTPDTYAVYVAGWPSRPDVLVPEVRLKGERLNISRLRLQPDILFYNAMSEPIKSDPKHRVSASWKYRTLSEKDVEVLSTLRPDIWLRVIGGNSDGRQVAGWIGRT